MVLALKRDLKLFFFFFLLTLWFVYIALNTHSSMVLGENMTMDEKFYYSKATIWSGIQVPGKYDLNPFDPFISITESILFEYVLFPIFLLFGIRFFVKYVST